MKEGAMNRKDVSFEGRLFGSAALVISVGLDFKAEPDRLREELAKRLDILPNTPRLTVVIKRDVNYPYYNVYNVVLPYLGTEQLEQVYDTIRELEREILELKREQALLGLLAD